MIGSEPLANAKHEHFCQLLNNGESAPKAYVLAGYSEKGAVQGSSRLLRNVDVSSRLAYLRKLKEQKHSETVSKVIEEAGITKEWILRELVDNVKIAKAAEPVLDSEGNPIGEYRTNIPAANKALELLGSEIGMFVKKVESGKPGDFDNLQDDELERRLKQTEDALRLADATLRTAATPTGKAQKAES